ncbi:MAG: 5-oxoprolinase subunit PxpA [Psychroserpens sp.]|uniref:5-oxoprolinase subunit PxpA n=1 Tax=Psychroserpens sp. TaxID=2020870 RepID=UPI003C7551C1
MKKLIDINCDLGEGLGNESQLMPYLSSCNIACGGHAGDDATMRRVVDLAIKYKVKVGAHPSFPDKENFGRNVLDISPKALHESLFNQMMSLKSVVDDNNVQLHHIKPHGALYNLAARNKTMAQIIVDVVKRFDENMILYVPDQSVILELALKNDIKMKLEAFADRKYNDDLSLVSRQNEGAIIHDFDSIFKQVYGIIYNGKVTTINGVEVALKVDTFCVHGDHDNVVENLRKLVEQLKANHIEIS